MRRLAAILRSDAAVLRYSNLARLLKYSFGPTIKIYLWPATTEVQLGTGLQATKRALARLDALSYEYGFEYRVYLLHPVADLLRGTHTDTASQLQAILPDPSVELTSTAPLYLADPTFYYFPIDGRINAAGAEAFARLLIEENVANPDS